MAWRCIDFLSVHRPDMMIFANRDAVRVSPRFNEIIIPVEWRDDYKSRDKTRETLQLTNRAVQDGKATVLFPSGRIAFWNEGRLTERPWKLSAVTLAKRHELPVVPVNMSARNSGLFYWLSKHSTELRDMTVFPRVAQQEASHLPLHRRRADHARRARWRPRGSGPGA
jgi:putative hemolysin